MRKELSARRANETIGFTHSGVKYTATVGFYPDGTLGEIFLEGGKLTSAADVSARDAAIAASIALQHGATIGVLRAACLRQPDGGPEGALGAALDEIVGMTADV